MELLFREDSVSILLMIVFGISFQVLGMTAIVERQTAKETQIIFVRFTSLNVAIQGGDSEVVHDVPWKIFSSTVGMIAEFCHKPGDIGH